MRRPVQIVLAASCVALLAVGLTAWRSAPARDRFAYAGIPAGFGFPTPDNVLEGYVYSEDERAMREHAWNLWAGMTAPSGSTEDGRPLPVWETWYSVAEVFGARDPTASLDERRVHTRDFQEPAQAAHARRAFRNEPAAVLSFVKYDRAAAEHIRSGRLYLQSTLERLNAAFDRKRAPPAERSIAPFPNAAASLKAVFWLVEGGADADDPEGLTVFPFWDPGYAPPPGGKPPGPATWTRCVLVDPSGKHVGETRTVDCNGTKKRPNPAKAEVIGLDRFYAVRLSSAADVAAARAVFKAAPDRLPPGDREAELGDYLALVAMHVTTKEMAPWTWQTFWWSPTPDSAPFGSFRTASVKGVWRNYELCTAYSMVTPRTAAGRPRVCFNPYLETDLGPTTFFRVGREWFPPDPAAGTRSNCMSCHARAAWPSTGPDNANYGRIFNEGYLAPDDPYYDGLTKVDFLWSIVGNARAAKKR